MARRVEIVVSGGVADLKCKSKGVEVTIFDYDVDGEDADLLQRDDEGQLCCVGRRSSQTVVS